MGCALSDANRVSLAGLVLAAAGLTACVGAIGDSSGSTSPRNTSQFEELHSNLRRLTNWEYARTTSHLFGRDTSAISTSLPEDNRVEGFDNNVSTQMMSLQHVLRYKDAAEQLASLVYDDDSEAGQFIGCEPDENARDACLRAFAERFGRLAFRRPLDEEQVQALLEVAQAASLEEDPYGDFRLMTEAILLSPHFLFRIEIGSETNASEFRDLDAFEVASRLSFLIYGMGPDEAMLDLAADGTLDSPSGIEATARSMLADPRAKESLQNFTDQWLHLWMLQGISFDPARFPVYTSALQQSMLAEVRELVSDYVWEHSNILEMYTSPYTYVNEDLAAVYGLEDIEGSELIRHEWSSEDRGGILSAAGVLSLTSSSLDASPIHRGLFVREVVLCDPLPPPPPDIEPAVSVDDESSADTLERHSSDPVCQGCHVRIDPIGFGLERYDALGAIRTTYPSGDVILERYPSGEVLGLENPVFHGAKELGANVVDSTMAQRCVSEHFYRWAEGRLEHADDAAHVQHLHQAFEASGFNIRDLLMAYIMDQRFRQRAAFD